MSRSLQQITPYFSGLVTWDGFDDYLTLYDKSSQSFGGAHWIDSEWGYRVVHRARLGCRLQSCRKGAEPMSGTLIFR